MMCKKKSSMFHIYLSDIRTYKLENLNCQCPNHSLKVTRNIWVRVIREGMGGWSGQNTLKITINTNIITHPFVVQLLALVGQIAPTVSGPPQLLGSPEAHPEV